jgi:predicted phage terminase large subunit-like protein
LVKSPWFQGRFSDRVAVAKSEDTAETISVWSTRAGGKRFSTTVGGQATGFHAHIQVVDDPNKPEEIKADPEIARAALERTWTWWNRTMASRKKDPRHFSRVIIMQRLHEDDLVGRILNSQQAKEYAHLSLPMQFEAPGCVTRFGGDRRAHDGELLCPDRFDAKTVETARLEMGSQVAAAQLQQRPAPVGGNVFKRDWFRERWTELPADLMLVQSWDCTFKDSAQADFVAGHIWGYSGGKFYLVDRIHDRMGLPETCAGILGFCRRWPKAYAKLIEDKANGPAVEQVLRDKVTGIIMVDPSDIGGSKVARANAVAPLAEAKNIVFPDASIHPWADDVLEEVVTFPFARHDDDVDAMTMAILHLHGRSNARYLQAMKPQNIEAASRILGTFRRTA